MFTAADMLCLKQLSSEQALWPHMWLSPTLSPPQMLELGMTVPHTCCSAGRTGGISMLSTTTPPPAHFLVPCYSTHSYLSSSGLWSRSDLRFS